MIVQGKRPARVFKNSLERNVGMVVQQHKRIAVGHAGIRARIARIELDRLREHSMRQFVIRLRMSMQELPASQIIRVRFDIVGARLTDRLLLLRQEFYLQLLDNRMSDLILDRKNIRYIAVESLRPQMPAV